MAVERAEPFCIAGHVVEQDRGRRAATLLGEHLGDAAHFGVPMGAIDAEQFAHLLDFIQPSPQAAIAHDVGRLGFAGSVGEGHGISYEAGWARCPWDYNNLSIRPDFIRLYQVVNTRFFCGRPRGPDGMPRAWFNALCALPVTGHRESSGRAPCATPRRRPR